MCYPRLFSDGLGKSLSYGSGYELVFVLLDLGLS